MKTNFDKLIEYRSHAMERARCPYSEDERRQMVEAAIMRVEASLRQERRYEFRRYAVAACVALLVGVAAYHVIPSQECMMHSSLFVRSSYVVDSINSMFYHEEIS